MRSPSSFATLALAALLFPAALPSAAPVEQAPPTDPCRQAVFDQPSAINHQPSANPQPNATAIPWNEIGAKAGAQYQGKSLSVTEEGEGARLTCGFQKMEGRATCEGLWLTSSAAGSRGERFRVAATAVGRGEAPGAALPSTGPVRVVDSVARWERAGLAEEYSVSIDGVRQDFVVAGRPAGDGLLRVDLALTGARAETAPYGAKLTLEGSYRALAYSRLRVVDAKGQELAATLTVTASDRLAICVDDADAAYPVRIDPTFSDANWVSLDNPSIPGVNGFVNAAVLDSAGNLYIAGSFTVVGSVFASCVAKWNGTSWSPLGSGTGGQFRQVYALAAHGTNIYAGGAFATAGGVTVNGIAKWDGSAWSALGAGTTDGAVLALAANSTTVYVAGNFLHMSGLPGITSGIAQWDIATSTWSGLGTPGVANTPDSMGTGLNSQVKALALSGTKLYVGGIFSRTYSVPVVEARGVAQWDISTSTWSALSAAGIQTSGGGVAALAVSGSTLYAGGRFGTAGGNPATNIAKWDGSAWSAMGVVGGLNHSIEALAVSGTTLYVGGSFVGASGGTAKYVAKWDGATSWSALGLGTGGNDPTVYALAASGTTLYVGGTFTTAGGKQARGIATWDDSSGTWSTFGSGMNNPVTALAVTDTKLYAGGSFTAAGSVSANAIAQWDGTGWSALGAGIGGQVLALAVDGPTVYAGGIFTTAGGQPANYIAKWDSNASTWSTLGSGMDFRVNALAMIGSTLYAGGRFNTAGGVPAVNIAQWNGSAWSALGAGLPGSDSFVQALAVSGTTLYAGGFFTTAGGAPGDNIARWNGSAWSPLGAGTNNGIFALAVSGTTLYAGGLFNQAGGVSANKVAQWNGSAWSALGSGLSLSQAEQVYALAVDGTTVYAGGDFTTANGAPANYIAQWNGSAWTSLASGTNFRVHALARGGTMLYVGGAFLTVGAGTLAPYIAALDLAPPIVTASTANLPATATTLIIDGTGFDWQASHNTVAFTPAGSGVVTAATSTSLTVTGLTGLSPGPLYAVVSTNGYTSGAPVQVATVIAVAPVIDTPTGALVTSSSARLGGRLVASGGAPATLGVVFSPTATNPNPQIGGPGVTNLIRPGAVTAPQVFTVDASGLAPRVQYSFAAYATNSVGTTYTAVSTFTTLNNVATLSSLVLSRGTLSPSFDPGTLEYTAYVTSSPPTITVTATSTAPDADIYVNGLPVTSGSASPDIVLSPGINTVFIDVYAEDLAILESYIVTVTQLTGYPDWRLTYFGTLENSGATEDTASYVGDGIPNLLKYALGMNPLVAALPPALTQAETSSGDPLLQDRLALRFTLPNTAPFDVNYTVEASPDLITWTDVATKAGAGGWTWVADAGPSRVVEGPPGTTATILVGDFVPSSGNAPRVMRLRVTLP